MFAIALVLIAAAMAASYFTGNRAGYNEPPRFQRLTFRNGTVAAARFAPDSRLVVYAALWEGRPSEIFTCARAPGRLHLQDISKDGRVLVTREDARMGMMALAPGEPSERDLSWLDGSWLRDISADGLTLLFDEENNAGDKTPAVYIRHADGGPAVKLGDGNAVSLSPDGLWALTDQRYTSPPRLVLLPTGAGEVRPIDSGEIEWRETGMWFPIRGVSSSWAQSLDTSGAATSTTSTAKSYAR